MQFAAALSTSESADGAARQLARGVEAVASPDLAVLWFSAHHVPEAETLARIVAAETSARCVVGCSAEGVIANDREVERAPSAALLTARLPGATLRATRIAPQEWSDLLGAPDDLLERVGADATTRALLVLADPWSTPVNPLLGALAAGDARLPLLGGMASAAGRAGGNVLLCDEQRHADGMVALALGGDLRVDGLVSQGCRPIGKPFVVTRARENVIEQLGGRTALVALREVIESLDAQEQAMLRHGLLIGRAMSEYRDRFGRGDFVVRNLVGVDQERGALALGDLVRVGQTVQFHVRDAASADEELRRLLAEASSDAPVAALLFNCNGRGTRLFEQPDHDARAVREALGAIPLAGFFAAGEFGPVGGRNFLHGHTASLALFRPPAQP